MTTEEFMREFDKLIKDTIGPVDLKSMPGFEDYITELFNSDECIKNEEFGTIVGRILCRAIVGSEKEKV